MQLQGPGSMTKRKLVVVTYDNNKTKDGKTQYLDVQLDARDEFAPGQTNLHAVTRSDKDKDGNVRYTNGAPYSADQFEAIKAAAGDNYVQLANRDGSPGPHVYTVEANVMPATRGSGIIINTKGEMGPGLEVDDKIIDRQFESVAAAKAAKDAEKSAQVDAPEAETEAAVEQSVEHEEPEV